MATYLLLLELAACGSTSHPSHAAHTAVAQQPAAAATQSQSCASQVQAWAHDQGSAQLHRVGSDETALSKDGHRVLAALRRGGSAAGPLARWQADSTALETDAQAAIANPPPACANAADYGTAMQDYTTAAKDYISSIGDFTAGNYGGCRHSDQRGELGHGPGQQCPKPGDRYCQLPGRLTPGSCRGEYHTDRPRRPARGRERRPGCALTATAGNVL